MKKLFQTLIFLGGIAVVKAQAPPIKWQHSYGGSGFDEAHAIDVTSDGGYIMAGFTTSDDDQVTNFHFNFDYWVVKLNSNGAIQWESAFGGSADDEANDVHQTRDGGYIVAGFSESGDGDLQGVHGHGDADFWILKLDANGNKQWSKEYGGIGDDIAHSIRQTSDGGYIIAGESLSSNIQGNHGGDDYFVVKIDSVGNVQWQKPYGGSNADFANAVLQESDGSYMVVGGAASNNAQVTGNHGLNDYWVLHLDANGNIIWQKTYGGSAGDIAYSIADAGDGGFLVAGQAISSDGQITGSHGGGDYWIIKIDGSGNLLWQKDYGGTNWDQANSIFKTKDGGYLVTGLESSNDGDVTGNHGLYDFWVLKLKANGNLQWQEALGGSVDDEAFSGRQTPDGGYILAGFTSSNDGQVTHNFGGNADFWVVKLKKSAGADESESSEQKLAEATSPASFFVYSNQNNQIQVNLNANDSRAVAASIQMVNETGQIIFNKTVALQNGKLETSIQMNNELNSGIYFAIATVGEKKYTAQFVIR